MHTLSPNHLLLVNQPIRIARGKTTLLLVDDDAMVRELLQTVLSMAGYNVIAAPDGSTAIEISRQSSFDMLVTDFSMPGMNGYVLAGTLTESRPWLPVLMVSATHASDLPMDGLAQRGWSLLPKPVSNAKMLQVIDSECLGWAVRARRNESLVSAA